MAAFKLRNLSRYKDLLLLLKKHGGIDMDKGAMAVPEDRGEQHEQLSAEELARDLEALGPVFVKIGQLLSSRPDIVTPAQAQALSRLTSDVAPESFEDIHAVVREELGADPETVFERFDKEPLAAASLGQVHIAHLRDGRKVAVKVQRPNVRELARDDMGAIGEVAAFLTRHTRAGRRYQLDRIADELAHSLGDELDYLREARNMQRLRELVEPFDDIVVPEPITDLCTSRLLVMDYINGTSLTKLSPVVLTELDGHALADSLFRAYMHQTLVHGFFHADPHPGNVLLDREGRIVLLDCGMVGHFTEPLRKRLLELLLAISEGAGDRAASVALRLSGEADSDASPEDFRTQIRRLVQQNTGAGVENIQAGRVILEICRTAARCGILLPTETTLLGKTLLQLDELAQFLAPEFDPNAAVRRHVTEVLHSSAWKETPAQIYRTLLEAKEFVEHAPHRFNRVLEMAADNDLSLRVESPMGSDLVHGFEKASNRIAASVVLGSTIVGAGLLSRVETEFTLFGYPGLAILFFLIAALGALVLLVAALISARRMSMR